MRAGEVAFETPAGTPPPQRWLVFSPLARIVFFAVLMFAFGFAMSKLVQALGWTAPTASPVMHGLATMCLQLIPVLAYVVLVMLIERRPMQELSLRTIPTLGSAGLLFGIALMSTVVAVLWLLGSYHVTGTNTHVNWLPEILVVGIGAGIGEELVVRGVLYRVTEEGLGTWAAIIVSAAFFGIAHIFNPGATLWSSAAIAIEAGVLLALIYNVTRSLWACIGMHAGWNIMQGTVYGIPVSGGAASGWLVSNRTGPNWLSGGAFGAEASVVAIGVSALCSVALLIWAVRKGSIVPPSWVRKRAHAHPDPGYLDRSR